MMVFYSIVGVVFSVSPNLYSFYSLVLLSLKCTVDHSSSRSEDSCNKHQDQSGSFETDCVSRLAR